MSGWPHPEAFLQQCFPALSQFKFVAKGGQKAVYSAMHPTAGQVALKILSPSDTPERFQREISAIQMIDAQQVPLIIEHGKMPEPYEGNFWMTEEWISGLTLREKIEQGPISNQLILKVATDILSVLIKAEHHRIVHRDIKPENIIIAPDESHCWLIDFGIARHLDRTSLTGLYMPCTIGYAPVEQLDVMKSHIDTRSDLFSLGVTLYECVEGVNPFIDGATSLGEIVDRIHNTQLPRISREIDVKGEFGNLLQTLTQTRRNHRLESAEEALKWMNDINIQGHVE